MRRKALAFSVAALSALAVSASAVQPAARAEDRACLQNNRIWGWRTINERTLVVTDRAYRPFLVRLSGGCVGLNDAIFALRFRTVTDLGCLRPGDSVSFHAPALGEMSCFVRDVQPYEPGHDERYSLRRRDPER